MKKALYIIIAICLLPALSYPQKSDSADVTQGIKKIENEIQKIYNNALIQNQKSEKISEEINVYFKNQLEELTKLQNLLENNSTEFKNMQEVLSEIGAASEKNTRKIKGFELRNYIIQFVLFGLLIFLIVFVIRFRRQSLDYLLTKANNLADQNDIIIEKADELTTIKENLKTLIAEQEKRKKEEKASRKKKKKK